jgi:DnaK suppressor protein
METNVSHETEPYYRARLETLRDELRVGLIQGEEESRPVAPDRAIGRLTRQEAIQAQQMSLELRRRRSLQLRQVEQALRRMDAGTFGMCLRCGEEIGTPRLEARPEAHLCLRCADRV